MPPRTRAAKSTKGLKENIVAGAKAKLKTTRNDTKPTRKVLADKTNSASDDNASIEVPKKLAKKPSVVAKTSMKENDSTGRSRRDRRLPNRYAENKVLNNLSNSKEKISTTISVAKPKDTLTPIKKDSRCNAENKVLQNLSNSKENTPTAISVSKKNNTLTPVKKDSTVESPFKSPQNVNETSLIAARPRRVCRLPSKFDDHSISPHKFIPVQPSYASTPLAQKDTAKTKSTENKKNVSDKVTPKTKPVESSDKKVAPKKASNKASSDTNNNPKGRTLRTRNVVQKETNKSLSPIYSPEKKIPVKKASKKPVNKNFSFKVLEDNNKNESNQDVYEFTYDPNEEPPPQKKKKKVARKRPAKPKTVIVKNFYDMNVSKALTALKKVVASNQARNDVKATVPNEPQKSELQVQKTLPSTIDKNVQQRSANVNLSSVPQVQRNVASKIIITAPQQQKTVGSNIQRPAQGQQNIQTNIKNAQSSTDVVQLPTKIPEEHKSIRVEDIAADFEPTLHNDINYSPVNSPMRPKTPVLQQSNTSVVHVTNDPLNLRENLSFFDENPVASSSMNTSTRHPHASPWRVEFNNLPIRWHVNSYVKANMTPAVECSFVNFEDNKKKHVYTNLVPESDDPLPEIVQKDKSNLVQSSIISFVKEVMEKSSSKKRASSKGRSVTPVTASLFNDTANNNPTKNLDNINKTTRQLFTPKKNPDKATSDLADENVKDTSSDKENSKDTSKGKKRKNDADPNEVPAKTPRKEKDNTYFGFDDSENQDPENVSPKKIAEGRKHGLRSRARAALKEINEQKGPTRALVPVAAKTRSVEVEKLYDQMKSATDAPVFPDKEQINNEATDVNQTVEESLNEVSESVHLFEDIELIHHFKPQRKSYGKAKKVTFRQNSDDDDSNSVDGNNPRAEVDNSDEEDLDDITFDPGMPLMEEKKTKKKQTKKQKMTKKEKEEADAWAANFNSMCEDVDEFPLIVE